MYGICIGSSSTTAATLQKTICIRCLFICTHFDFVHIRIAAVCPIGPKQINMSIFIIQSSAINSFTVSSINRNKKTITHTSHAYQRMERLIWRWKKYRSSSFCAPSKEEKKISQKNQTIFAIFCALFLPAVLTCHLAGTDKLIIADRRWIYSAFPRDDFQFV